jgi:DNA-binding MarR family transcriptional regulator
MSAYPVQRQLRSLTREISALRGAIDSTLAGASSQSDAARGASNLGMAEGILKSRRLREDLFGAEMFADPAWDMLLHLFVSGEGGRKVPVSCLCAASAVPQSTALRWIDTLANAGLLDKRLDTKDGRRIFVALTSEAAQLMRLHMRRTRAFLLAPSGS